MILNLGLLVVGLLSGVFAGMRIAAASSQERYDRLQQHLSRLQVCNQKMTSERKKLQRRLSNLSHAIRDKNNRIGQQELLLRKLSSAIAPDRG